MASSIVKTYLGDCANHFAVFGALVSAYIAFKFCSAVYRGFRTHFLSNALGLSANVARFGKWAVITGATDGIGKEYAVQLAKKGMCVVLISRSKDKLEDVAQEIKSKYKVETKTITVDFSSGPEIYDVIRKGVESLDIGVLVNNVGMSYRYPEFFCDIPDLEKTMLNLININITSVTMMTSIILPGMAERRKGAVINVASASGMETTPLLTAYSASKAYMDFFSRGLQEEYRSKGIIIQSVMPFFVATKMSRVRKPSLNIPSAETYVRAALATLGVADRTNGYWVHDITACLMSVVPDWLLQRYVWSMHMGFRKRAHRAAAQKRQ